MKCVQRIQGYDGRENAGGGIARYGGGQIRSWGGEEDAQHTTAPPPRNYPTRERDVGSGEWPTELIIKGEPELTDPFNLLINVKLRMLWNWNFFYLKEHFNIVS